MLSERQSESATLLRQALEVRGFHGPDCLQAGPKSKSHYGRQSVGQSFLVSGPHPGPATKFFFLLEIFLRQLRVSYFVAPSLKRGWVCNLPHNCFWALPEQSLLGPSPAELTATFYCLIWDSPNLQGQIPVFISPRNRVAQLYPRVLGSLLSPLTTLRATVEVF
jgi:hypothetical protein